MNQVLKCIVIFSFLMIIFICVPGVLFAQGDPGCDPLCNCRADGSICPIDGEGLYFLLAAGIGYGIFKIRRSHRKETAII